MQECKLTNLPHNSREGNCRRYLYYSSIRTTHCTILRLQLHNIPRLSYRSSSTVGLSASRKVASYNCQMNIHRWHRTHLHYHISHRCCNNYPIPGTHSIPVRVATGTVRTVNSVTCTGAFIAGTSCTVGTTQHC